MNALPAIDWFRALDAWREGLALQLETLSISERRTVVLMAVVSTGGTFVEPDETNWGPLFAELTLGGIHADGADLDECIAGWIKAVLRASRAAAEEAA